MQTYLHLASFYLPNRDEQKRTIVKIQLYNIDNITSKALGSRRYLGAVFGHLMYRYERHIAKARLAVICLYCTTYVSED